MKKYLNTITWSLLVGLIIVSYSLAETSTVSLKWALPLILLLSGIKFIGVSFIFMEMKNADIAWKIILLGFIFVFSFFIAII